ncbi:MAG TPA: ThiF family adenylyltransferase [Nakamurella sp.]
MPVLPRLKAVPVHGHGGTLVLSRRSLERIHLDDPSGAVLALLRILSRGDHTLKELPFALATVGHSASVEDVSRVVHQLDDWGVLERADSDGQLDARTIDRHASNLRYYDLFSDLSRSSVDMHRAATRSTVLLLGAGGLGSGILQSLVGLGVGKIILVDGDVVEPKNLARQFVYNSSDIGRPKVQAAADWVSGYSPDTTVRPVQERVADAARIGQLAGGADLVVCAIDSPDNVHLLVNEACCRLGIPFVAGGLARSTLSYWSVDPGRSACRECLELHRRAESLGPALEADPILGGESVNRATGPIAQLAAGFMTMEAMRYLTGSEAPVAAAEYHVLELADGMTTSRARWTAHPDCSSCRIAERRR